LGWDKTEELINEIYNSWFKMRRDEWET
jgi:hypothetical protein